MTEAELRDRGAELFRADRMSPMVTAFVAGVKEGMERAAEECEMLLARAQGYAETSPDEVQKIAAVSRGHAYGNAATTIRALARPHV